MSVAEKAKTFIGGLVIGLIAAAVTGFSMGWVVTAGTAELQVREAKLDQLAAICASRVRVHLEKTEVVEDLSGWEKRDERKALAKKFAVVMPGEESPESAVINECADRIV